MFWVYIISYVLWVILLVYCIGSWFMRGSDNIVFQIVSKIVDPILYPIRKVLGSVSFFSGASIDLSPVILMMLISFAVKLVSRYVA